MTNTTLRQKIEPVTEYKVGDKVIPHLHWPDRRSIHLMGHKIDGGQDPVQQLRSWLAAWMGTQKEMVDFGWQCYQDRCENAYVEASVVKRIEEEHMELLKAIESNLSTLLYRGSILDAHKIANESREILRAAIAKTEGT